MNSLFLEPGWTLMLLLTGAVYLVALEFVRAGLKRLEGRNSSTGWRNSVDDAGRPFASVIIPCRDEAQHIGRCLDDLARQDYPADRFEVIVVDDRSDDGSGEIARSYRSCIPNLKVLRLDSSPPEISPKKNALRRGMGLARGEIFITTDADCRLNPGWISSLISEMEPHVGLVTGLTVFERGIKEPIWQRMQQLDYLSHSFFAAGAIRCAFDGVGGYDDFKGVVTGDDTLLLQRLQRSGRWTVRFCAKPDNLVRSWPEETPRDVLNQRLRWGSGGLSYSSPALVFALTTFGFFLALLASPLLWAAGLIAPYWIILLVGKSLQEARVLKRGFQAFHLKPDWLAFMALEIIHIPAILTFSIGGHLLGFRWKGQRFRRKRAAYPAREALGT
jgi:cellulose synthase/poly-beta-1,6-N-acetylglucosamine synthase-like glycosyltransferase